MASTASNRFGNNFLWLPSLPADTAQGRATERPGLPVAAPGPSTAGWVTPPHSLLHGFRSRGPPRRPRHLLTHPSLSGIILPQCEGESLCTFFSVKLPRHGPFARPPSQNPGIYQSPQHISGCSECVTRHDKADRVLSSNSLATPTGF